MARAIAWLDPWYLVDKAEHSARRSNASSRETDRRWPATAIFKSLEEWVDESMTPLHHELANLR